jgi:hypothetical protein
MVKIQDGSLVPASELIEGRAEDDDGKPLKFEQVKDANVPTYKAVSEMSDGSGRVRNYSFSIVDTNVRVGMAVTEKKEEAAEQNKAKTEKVTKEVTPTTTTTTTTSGEAKKNSTTTGSKL